GGAAGLVRGWLAALAVVAMAGAGLVGTAASAAAAVPAARAVTSAAVKARAGTVPAAPFVVSVSGVGLGVLTDWVPNPASNKVTSYAVTATPAQGSTTASCPSPAPVTVSASPADTSAIVGGLCASV